MCDATAILDRRSRGILGEGSRHRALGFVLGSYATGQFAGTSRRESFRLVLGETRLARGTKFLDDRGRIRVL